MNCLSDAALSRGRGRWPLNRVEAAAFPTACVALFPSFKIKVSAFKGRTLRKPAFSGGGRRKRASSVCCPVLPGVSLTGGIIEAGEISVQYY